MPPNSKGQDAGYIELCQVITSESTTVEAALANVHAPIATDIVDQFRMKPEFTVCDFQTKKQRPQAGVYLRMCNDEVKAAHAAHNRKGKPGKHHTVAQPGNWATGRWGY